MGWVQIRMLLAQTPHGALLDLGKQLPCMAPSDLESKLDKTQQLISGE